LENPVRVTTEKKRVFRKPAGGRRKNTTSILSKKGPRKNLGNGISWKWRGVGGPRARRLIGIQPHKKKSFENKGFGGARERR